MLFLLGLGCLSVPPGSHLVVSDCFLRQLWGASVLRQKPARPAELCWCKLFASNTSKKGGGVLWTLCFHLGVKGECGPWHSSFWYIK